VALEKVDGVDSVNVTLKRGMAHVTLAAGNRVTLADLRRIVKNAGYSSREATVTVVGVVRSHDRELRLVVSGTSEVFDLTAPNGGLADAERVVDQEAEITGIVLLPEEKQPRERLQVQTVSVVR
jgi:hypothetical protein